MDGPLTHRVLGVLGSNPAPSTKRTADAFLSVAIFDRDGVLEESPCNSFNIDRVTAAAEVDGSVVLHLAPEGHGVSNHLYIVDGWYCALRLYRPRASVLDKT